MPSSIPIIPRATPQQCSDAIDRLIKEYRELFKRNPSVDLFIAATFGTDKPPAARRAWANQDSRQEGQTPIVYSVVAHLPDAANDNHRFDVEWLNQTASGFSLNSISQSNA